MSYKLVIARYNEELDWVNNLNKDNVIIYNKGSDYVTAIKRENIGREVESFFYYIIENYYNLPDYVIFLQGNPFDHMHGITPDNLQQQINALINSKPTSALPLFHNYNNEHHNQYPDLKVGQYFSLFFNTQLIENVSFSSGCQYIIPKHIILNKPIQFYSKIHSMTIIGDFNNGIRMTTNMAHFEEYDFNCNGINGWILERLLAYVFSDIPVNDFLLKKRYLVTGGCGFIGSNLVKKLSENNNVIILDNLTTGSLNNLDYKYDNINIQLFNGDILDNTILKKIGYVDGIFHMAAMSKVLPSLENKEMIDFCVNQNINGTINILKYAASFKNPIKVIYSASSTYYGNNPIPHVETQLPNCQTPYAVSKYCGELYCELFSSLYNVPTVRLRYFMVYGKNEPNEGSYAVVSGIFLKNKKDNLPLNIHGDGSQTRDFVSVDDVVKANILAMTSSITNETINVGTGKMNSIKELADLISDKQIHSQKRVVDLNETLCDTTKLESLLNWKPTNNITDYIKNF